MWHVAMNKTQKKDFTHVYVGIKSGLNELNE